MSEKVKIFISYDHVDAALVAKIYQRLLDAGFDPWIDREHLLPGVRWKDAIEKALREADFFLLCISAQSSNRRGFIQREINAALDLWQEKLHDDIYFIPVRLEDCELPDRVNEIQCVNWYEAGGWERLEKALRIQSEKLRSNRPPKPSPPSSLSATGVPDAQQIQTFSSIAAKLNDQGKVVEQSPEPVAESEILGIEKISSETVEGVEPARKPHLAFPPSQDRVILAKEDPKVVTPTNKPYTIAKYKLAIIATCIIIAAFIGMGLWRYTTNSVVVEEILRVVLKPDGQDGFRFRLQATATGHLYMFVLGKDGKTFKTRLTNKPNEDMGVSSNLLSPDFVFTFPGDKVSGLWFPKGTNSVTYSLIWLPIELKQSDFLLTDELHLSKPDESHVLDDVGKKSDLRQPTCRLGEDGGVIISARSSPHVPIRRDIIVRKDEDLSYHIATDISVR